MSRTTTTRIVAVVVCIVLLQFRYYYLGKLSDFDVQVQSLAERSAEADEDRLPSIAYSFNGYHGDYLSIPVALAAVFHSRNVYCVLVDASISAPQVLTLQRLIVQAVLQQYPGLSSCAEAGCIESRIFVSAADFSVTWAGISEPLATLDAMAQLLKVDENWEFFVNLTPVDYPLASQNDISKLLADARGFSFMGTFGAGMKHASGMFEDRWHRIYHDPGLLRKRDTEGDRQELIRTPHSLPKKIVYSPFLQVFQSEAYGVFDRTFCQHAVNSPLARRTIALLSHGFASSEQLLSTILGNSEEYGYCPSALRMNSNAGGPNIEMKIDHTTTDDYVQNVVREMASTGLFFARKFPNVCVKSDDHCQNAYNNEPYRTAVSARLVQDTSDTTSSQHQHPPLQQVWRAAAKAKLKELLPRCRQPVGKKSSIINSKV